MTEIAYPIARQTTESPVILGPLLEGGLLSAGLDYYKPAMSQLEFEKHPDAEVTFTFKNRSQTNLAEYIDPWALQTRLNSIRVRNWTSEEIEYFRDLTNSKGERIFADNFLEYLMSNQLPEVDIQIDPTTSDLAISTTGEWPLVTFWETIIMSEVNEAYFEGMVRAQNIDIMELYDEGDRRLSEKIAFFQANPDIKFTDFGTRRRFSLRWHRHVVERFKNECPENFIGTSNVALARNFDLKPIGTFAHELPMVYAGLADALGKGVRASHGQMLDDWYGRYGDDLSIYLSDTFGSDFFFDDLTMERAISSRGTRQDSGDPLEYGEKAIAYYQSMGINPLEKVVVFSDNLNIIKVDRIHRMFKGRIRTLFGIGTFFTNDLGVKPPNNVMKATHVRIPSNGLEADLVKISDDKGKHTGPAKLVERYEQGVFNTKV